MAASFVTLIRNRQSVPLAIHGRASIKMRASILEAQSSLSDSNSSGSELGHSSGDESDSDQKDPILEKLNLVCFT